MSDKKHEADPKQDGQGENTTPGDNSQGDNDKQHNESTAAVLD